jgi:hypothetical protein
MSNHPIEQKTAAYRFHITRMHSLPLDQNKKQKEWQTIQSIPRNNNFPQHRLQKLNRQIHNETDHTRNRNKDNKGPGPHSLIIVPKYGKSPTCLEIPR